MSFHISRFSILYRHNLIDLTLTILQWISAAVPDIITDINPKSKEHVYNYRRPHRKEGDINKVLTDGGTGYSYFFTNIGANPKHLPFNKVLELIHTAKL